MDFIGLAMVKNEEDIIEQFVRHNLTYLTKLYILDHSSSDYTSKILDHLAAEGLPVIRMYNNNDSFVGYAQAEITNLMLRSAVLWNGPGVYFPIDADEFFYTKISLDEFKLQVDELESNVVLNIPLLNTVFPIDAGIDVFTDAPKSFLRLESWSKNVPRPCKVALKISTPEVVNNLMLMQGNHDVYSQGKKVEKSTQFTAVSYIHVPVRSPEQAFRKIVCGWLSNVQKFGKNSAMATHWRTAFNLICEEDAYASNELAYLLNNIYAGHIDIINDSEEFDAKSIFNYELAYKDMRKKGLGVVLRNIESDFESIHKKNLK